MAGESCCHMVAVLKTLRQKLAAWEKNLSPKEVSMQAAEQTLRAELLRPLLLASTLALVLYLLLGYGGYVRRFLFPWSALELLCAIGAAAWLLRQGRISLATVLLLTFLSHPIGFLIADYGLETPTPALLLPTVVICGLLIGKKLVRTWTLICAAILLWDALVRHELNRAHLPLLSFWLTMYAVMGWLTVLFSVHLERLLAAARQVEEAERTAVVAERTRMARELHDSLAQGFTGILVQTSAAEAALERQPDQVSEHLEQVRLLAQQSLQEARLAVWALRSWHGEGLLEQLTFLVDRLRVGSELELTVFLEGTPRPLPADIPLQLLRIAQEAITNTARHAQASQLTITLRYDPEYVTLEVADDGKGLVPLISPGFGQRGMQERAQLIGARLEFLHPDMGGVIVRTVVPCP